MQIINKKVLIIMLLIVSFIVGSYFYFSYKNKRISSVDAKNEIEYAEITKNDVEANPFIDKLPIRTSVYTVLYSSLNKQIVVIFNKSTLPIEVLKSQFRDEIKSKLSTIGYQEDNIIFEIEINP